MKKIKAEGEIIEKIINALKETVVISDETLEGTDIDSVIGNLDKELCQILDLADNSTVICKSIGPPPEIPHFYNPSQLQRQR